MQTPIIFHPLVKYILIFIIAYMYFNSINIPNDKIIPSLLFVILVSGVVDIFMFDEFIEIIQRKELSLENEQCD